MTLDTVSEQIAFGGVQGFYKHVSKACASTMKVAVYLPPQAKYHDVPVVFYLAGLTCTEETFTTKAGAQRIAAEHGIALVMPDTSPRETRYPGDDASWDFGLGASFYVDATAKPWADSYRMHTYVTEELPAFVREHFPIRTSAMGIMGHSMGGHGALVCALRNPDLYASVSAFAPICAPSSCPWGEKAFTGYLGDNRAEWSEWDACELVQQTRLNLPILIDQGTNDKFLERELKIELFREACARAKQPLEVRMREAYDHSYYFIATFLEEHLRYHARRLS